eukprot:847864-Prorocentrum_minimum.AAC.2
MGYGENMTTGHAILISVSLFLSLGPPHTEGGRGRELRHATPGLASAGAEPSLSGVENREQEGAVGANGTGGV